MGDYDDGYRAGVMAERRRCILVALRATNQNGNPSEEGHSLAHQISVAGQMIPQPTPGEPGDWSVFGERRYVKSVPSFLESTKSPFTAQGLLYIERLEAMALDPKDHKKWDREQIIDTQDERRTEIIYLRKLLADAPKKIAELEAVIEVLTKQLASLQG